MKKLFFALACVIGLMTFASCTQEIIDDIMAQKPVVEFVSGDGLTSASTGVYVNTELNFKVKVTPNSSSESELDNFDFSITNSSGLTVFNNKPEFTNPAGENFFEFSYTPEVASTYAVSATITDKAGKVNVVTIVVDVAEPIVAVMGTFNGTLNIQGHLSSKPIAGYETYDMDTTIADLPVKIALGAIDENNHVEATIEIEGTPVSLYGTIEDNIITFNEFHFRKTISLFVDVNLDFTMNLTGQLDEDNLTMTLGGTALGTGKTQVLIAMLEVTFDGTIDGTLEKARP